MIRTIAILGLFGGLVMSPQDGTPKDQVQYLRGTVNVALGNKNGMVIAADGLLSGGPHPRFAQKLFQLDQQSVCTVAGFYSTDDTTGFQFFQEPESALHLEIRSAIYRLREQLKKHSDVTIEEKMGALAFLISSSLERFNSLNEAQDSRTRRIPAGLSKFLIAGYNPDGSAEIAKAALSVDGEGKFTTVEEASLTAVNAGRLVWQTAGIEDEAVSVLQGNKLTPLKEADETLRVLYASEAKDGGASLSVEQMTQIAQKVVFYSSAAHPSSIGGDPQFAVLKGGKVLEVHQPEFQDPPLPCPAPLRSCFRG
jgi:hypothetical protein